MIVIARTFFAVWLLGAGWIYNETRPYMGDARIEFMESAWAGGVTAGDTITVYDRLNRQDVVTGTVHNDTSQTIEDVEACGNGRCAPVSPSTLRPFSSGTYVLVVPSGGRFVVYPKYEVQ